MRGMIVSTNRENRFVFRHALITVGVISLSLGLPMASASAGFFDLLFGGGRRAAPSAPSLPPVLAPLVAPFGGSPGTVVEGERRESSGPAAAYCVRLCDGHAFPVNSSTSSPAQACASMCPATTTKVFVGGSIDRAVANDGKRYSDLPNAFVYRKQLVAGCTCNGKSAGGLVRADVKSDPTLRPGDIVATNDGLVSYRGSNGRGSEFTPVSDRKLADVQIRQAPISSAALSANASAEMPARAAAPKDQRQRAQVR